MFYWHCYSLVVLIGTGFGVFSPCSFFKERLWFRRALLGHVDTGGAMGAASLTSECKCGNRSATTSPWVTRTPRECGAISFNTPLFKKKIPNGTHADFTHVYSCKQPKSCIISITVLLQTTLFKAKFIFKSHSRRQICIINTATAKKVNREVDPLLGSNSYRIIYTGRLKKSGQI